MFAWKHNIAKSFFFKINSLKIKNKQIIALILLVELSRLIDGDKNFIFLVNFIFLSILADIKVRLFNFLDK